jgi:hypothetical protein
MAVAIGASTISMADSNPLVVNVARDINDQQLQELKKIISDQLGLTTAAKLSLPAVMKDLQSKTYTELFAIKLNDETQTCLLTTCGDVKPATVIKLADAVLSARDKEESVRTTTVNSRIAVSGAILAVLSFAMSTRTTVATLRSKKPASVT